MNEIRYEEALDLPSPCFIDVRAPIEFAQDHIPGAINIPLFDDMEREEIGKLYTLVGQGDAIVRGGEIVGRKLSGILARITALAEKGTPVIYCFRGGMRSDSLTSLLLSLGFKVFRLKGGYKEYRRAVVSRLESFQLEKPLFVLHGLTGTGKTEILRHCANSIDLEEMAGHRSSVFGGIGLVARTQKHFESAFLRRIDELKGAPYLLCEGESKKIGDLHIPVKFFSEMMRSPGILVTAPIERRVDILLADYTRALDIRELESIVISLESRLGRKNTSALLEYLGKGELRLFTRFLLEKYYDPLYSHSLKKMGFLAEVENMDSARAAAEVVEIISGYCGSR